MSYYLYTETAFHHEGEIEYIKKLIDITKSSGASGIKFQIIFDINNLTSTRHSKYEFLENLVFSEKKWEEILNYAVNCGLDLIIMPLDQQSFGLIEKYEQYIKFLEIHSVSVNDDDLKLKVKKTNIPLILGVGGRTLEEIEKMVSFFGEQAAVLMHGFQSYPSKIENVRIEKISVLKEVFPNTTLGYADHSSYSSEFSVLSNEFAYLLGARIFEKHITVDEGRERVDFEAAVSKEKIAKINKRLSFIDEKIFSYASEEFSKLNTEELKYRNRQKVAVASKSINKGEKFTKENICFKMIDVESNFVELGQLENKISTRNILYDEVILEKDIEYYEK